MSILRAAVVAMVLVGLGASTAASEPVKIRIGYGEVPSIITPLLFQKKELLRHHGKSYVVDLVYFRGTTAQLPAFAAKELDMGYMAFGGLAHAILNAGLDLTVVTDLAQWGVPGYQSPMYVVLEDSGIKYPTDLKGKTLAVNVLGAGVHSAMTAALHKAGLRERADYTVVEVRFPAMDATLRERRVDLITSLPPFHWQTLAKGGVRELFSAADGMGRIQSLFNVARRGFLEANRAALVDFFEDYVRALRWFLDSANRAEAIQITAAFLKRPAAVFEGYVFTGKDYYRDPSGRPDLEALQRNIDQLVAMNTLPRSIPVKEHADLSFLEEAHRRLR